MDPNLLLGLLCSVALLVLIVVVALLVVVMGRMSALRKDLGSERTHGDEKQVIEREMTLRLLRENREELANSLARFEEMTNRNLTESRETTVRQLTENRDATVKQLAENRDVTVRQLSENRDETVKQLADSREMVEKRLTLLQQQNETKLEQMRATVDEKLQETVEKRFAESFKLISDRLEQVHKGLGEMQSLASGVDDLKKVLSNVKTRGNLGEYQLGTILEQVLSPEQYLQNAQVKPRSQERVEFAIRLPGNDIDGTEILLPIDSKFPVEDYERLLDAYEGAGDEGVDTISKRLEMRVKAFARDIRDKYLNPPVTTDFAIMFLPTEGLYAEILRRPGLFESLQREYRVTLVGPTNLVAFLSSLQMGFRTLAIEKRSSEVWQILGAVKNEFGKFEGLLDNVKKKLDSASSEIERIGSKSRNISRKLGRVQELPAEQSALLLSDGAEDWVEGEVLDEAQD
ncbi:MAG: DNA recombination protein RmuC [Coriobacteriia bacterium]|nr:DNA recombination protein RmuC [Coriobacteriia bacterium]